jgi:hypothetical protein
MDQSVVVQQDPLTMAAKRLGEAKTEATNKGMRMLEVFEQIQKEAVVLKQHGLSITAVHFENKAIDAAWCVFTMAAELGEMPMMEHEDSVTQRIRG